MANELQIDGGVSGKTVYFLLRNNVGQIWNGSNFVAYNSANYSTYAIAATEQGSTGYYVAAMPSVAFGVYPSIARLQAGGSPAESDITLGAGNVEWDGAIVTSIAEVLMGAVAGNLENNADVHSLVTCILKLTSKFDLGNAVPGFGVTYKTDGSTAKMTQSITTNNTLKPTQILGVGA